jgi:hypothetical protein
MPAPALVSSTPSDGAVNVYLNQRVTLNWDQTMQGSTMTPALMILEDTDLDEAIDFTVEYTTGALVATIVPDRQLEPNTTYRLQLTGTDTATSLGAIKASDSTDLATTIYILFTTGTEIETEGLPKTPEEEAAEGDLDLPDDVVITPTDFHVVSTNPENRAWKVARDLSEIRVTFSEGVDSERVNADSVVVDIFPFLEDPKHFAVPAFQGATADPTVEPQFEWQNDGEDATGLELDFDPPTGSLLVDGANVIWQKEADKDFPYNSCVEVTLDRSLADTGENELGIDQRFTFYTDPWPNWVSARRVRRALHPIDLGEFPDDVLGLAVWNASIEVGDLMQWVISDMELPPAVVRDLVECKTIADVFRMLLAQKQLSAGEYKRLGDMEHEVKYPTSRAADAKPAKLQAAEECIAKLEARIRNYWIGTPRIFIKGRLGSFERPNYRTRLWRLATKSFTIDSSPIVENLPAGNTAAERWPNTPGVNDPWA